MAAKLKFEKNSRKYFQVNPISDQMTGVLYLHGSRDLGVLLLRLSFLGWGIVNESSSKPLGVATLSASTVCDDTSDSLISGKQTGYRLRERLSRNNALGTSFLLINISES